MGKILIINNAEPGITKFSLDIAGILKNIHYPFRIIDYSEAQKTRLESFAGIILSGSPQGDDIVGHHLPYFKWIKDFEKPLLGICAGHHITGVLYGSELLHGKEPESGDSFVEVIKDDPLFTGLPRHFPVKQMHNDSITLPDEFDLLTTSPTCENQLMKHKQKPLYTCQFHPEYYNHDLIHNFVGLIQ